MPLSRPNEAELLRFELAGRDVASANTFACHDTGVILGRAMKMACAGGAGVAVRSLGGADGGSLDNPRFLYNQVVPEIAFGAPNADARYRRARRPPRRRVRPRSRRRQPRTKALGRERMSRKLHEALPSGDQPLRDALWTFLPPVLAAVGVRAQSARSPTARDAVRRSPYPDRSFSRKPAVAQGGGISHTQHSRSVAPRRIDVVYIVKGVNELDLRVATVFDARWRVSGVSTSFEEVGP